MRSASRALLPVARATSARTAIRALARSVLALLALCVAAAAVPAQEAVRVALLGPAEEPRFAQMADGLRRGLRDHGYSDAAIRLIEAKVARGDKEGARIAVASLLQQRPAAALVIGSELARIALAGAPELQIVFITPGDPVNAGLAASLARPGGNATAITFEFPELSGKRLELLQSLDPKLRRVLVFYDPRDASPRQGLSYAREAAATLGLVLVEREVQNRQDLDRGLEALREADAFVAIPGGSPSAFYEDIIRAANALRRPTFFPSRTTQTADALASYGARDADIAGDAARLVAKILRGERAGELPIERPSKIGLSINLKTAKAIGIAIPPGLLARADEVIE